MKGKILSVVAGVYSVFLEDQTIINLTPRGKFRHLKIKPCVGDNVLIENEMINDILPRKNLLYRPNIANIDLGAIVVSCLEPKFSTYLLDKFLTLLNQNNIKPMIILSKVDLVDDLFVEEIINDYQRLGIDVLPFSKYDSNSSEKIKDKIKGKTIAFMGQTGVGKSSLINALNPDFIRKVGEYSKVLHRGKHQTKEVVVLPFLEGYIADTPGFSSLELTCYKEELKDYFPFFALCKDNCFYLDCMHLNEPNCSVRKLVQNQIISEEHYQNYQQIISELIYRKDRFK